MTAWQSRPLERMYAVVFFDALRVKIRDEATVITMILAGALAACLLPAHRAGSVDAAVTLRAE